MIVRSIVGYRGIKNWDFLGQTKWRVKWRNINLATMDLFKNEAVLSEHKHISMAVQIILLLPSISGDSHSLERFLSKTFLIAISEILCGLVSVGLGTGGLVGAGTELDAMMAHNSSKPGEVSGTVEPFSSFASIALIFAWMYLRVVWPLCLILEVLYFFWDWLMDASPYS